MKLKYILVAAVLSLGVAAVAFAEVKETCIEFNGVSFCETETVIHIGEHEVPVTNPFDLLNSTKSSEADKIGLWDHYEYPAVITELSKQLMMTEDDLIDFLQDADPAWTALHELVTQYPSLVKSLKSSGVANVTIEKLFDHIVESINEDIRKQLTAYDGEQV